MSLDSSLRRSFENVKKDVLEVKNQLLNLAEGQEKLEVLISELSRSLKEKPAVKTVRVVRPKTAKQAYVASKEGEKFHILACPYAKNIKPNQAVKFKSKDAALNKGYKPCSCVVK